MEKILRKFLQFSSLRITLRKIYKKFTEVSDDVKNHHEFSQIFLIISLAEKCKNRNFPYPLLLLQYGGY